MLNHGTYHQSRSTNWTPQSLPHGFVGFAWSNFPTLQHIPFLNKTNSAIFSVFCVLTQIMCNNCLLTRLWKASSLVSEPKIAGFSTRNRWVFWTAISLFDGLKKLRPVPAFWSPYLIYSPKLRIWRKAWNLEDETWLPASRLSQPN